MNLLGQNQVNPDFTTGHIPTVTNVSITAFLGAFRYNEWTTPPTPSIRKPVITKPFPWVLYARKLRQSR